MNILFFFLMAAHCFILVRKILMDAALSAHPEELLSDIRR